MTLRTGVYIVPTHRWYIERTVWLIAGMVLLASTLLALLVQLSAQTPATQTNTTENLNFAMDGDLSFGYNDSFGSEAPSAGSLNFGGTANLKGYYYDPKFLSFNASPYYNQSRQNAESRSLFNNGGFDFTSNLFSGSHFPGSFNYSKGVNAVSQFGIPGSTVEHAAVLAARSKRLRLVSISSGFCCRTSRSYSKDSRWQAQDQ